MNEFGKRLRDARYNAGLTQGELAQRATQLSGITFQISTISRMECGIIPSKEGMIDAVAQVLGVTGAELLGETKIDSDRKKRRIPPMKTKALAAKLLKSAQELTELARLIQEA